jgi:16S rRNA (cytosine967-C5)-methyltransferase
MTGEGPGARLRTLPWEALRLDLALPAIERVLAGDAAEREIDRTLRRARGLSADERTALVETIFGVALWRRRLAIHAGSSEPRLLVFALLRDLAFVEEELAAALSGLAAPGANPAGQQGARSWIGALPPRRPAPPLLADRWSLPDWIEAAIVRAYGSEAPAFAEAICSPGPVCLRANSLRCTREELAASLAAEGVATRATALAPHGLIVITPRPNLFGLEAWRGGLFEPQDEGSQLLGVLVDAGPGETLLDFCAGAGGKALLLAAELQNEGAVIAHDIDRGRLERLRARAYRAGARCIEVGAPREADRVLVDAPCSELGVLRRGPDARWRAGEAAASRLPALQRELLEAAAPLARRRLVYATCTIRAEENEEVALAFERAHPELRRVMPPVCAAADGFFRCAPHTEDTDAFFAAIWERRAS